VPVLACKCSALYCPLIAVRTIGTCAVQHVMWCQAEYALFAKPRLGRGIRPQSPRRLHDAAVHMLTALLYSAVQLLAVTGLLYPICLATVAVARMSCVL
jgi:hypothetical protein